MASRRERIGNILKGLNPLDPQVREDFGAGFKDDYGIGKEDTTKTYYRQRDLEDATDEAPKFDMMANTHLGLTRTREALGGKVPGIAPLSREAKQAIDENDMALRGSLAHKVGQFTGSAANDITQDRSRSIYWLLNALQATGEVINEKVLAKAAPQLYSSTALQRPTIGPDGKKATRNLDVSRQVDREFAEDKGYMHNVGGKLKPKRGYSTKETDAGVELRKRNYSPGMVQALAIPTGIAINSGLGLLTPFGGAEGYKAAIPSEEDPTKTDNVLLEVAAKYIMGRTGNLLPYSDFKEVRPDVSPQEYGQYQAFKYDNSEDYNPLDGDFSVLMGALKGTTEGIHGPEIQMLGRSLPVTTGVVPYATALAGGAIGARAGRGSGRAAIGGLGGGTAGLVAGQVVGNLLEAERRRRNTAANEIDPENSLVI